MLKTGDLVEVVKPFYFYDVLYTVGQRFSIEEQHVNHNFESFVERVGEESE